LISDPSTWIAKSTVSLIENEHRLFSILKRLEILTWNPLLHKIGQVCDNDLSICYDQVS
jgi:hypothetical protein